MKAASPATVVTILLAATALAGCGGGTKDQVAAGTSGGSGTSSECKALQGKYPDLVGKKYSVGTSPGAGNYDNPNPSNPNDVQGLEPDILRAAAKCLGFSVTYKPQSFDGLIPSMKSGRIEIISSGMYATKERAQQVSFVTHLTAATAAVLPKGNPKKINSLDDTCGMKVAQVTGTVENAIQEKQNAKCTADGKKPAQASIYAGNDQAVNAVRQGRSDYFLTDAGVAAQVGKQFSKQIEAGFAVPSEFAFGFGVSKSNKTLLEGLHAALELAYKDGSLVAAQKKWGFAAEQKLEPATVTG